MHWLRWSLETLGALVLVGLACLMPRWMAHRVGRRLGGLAYLVSPRLRGVALENLTTRLGLDPAHARRVARSSLRQAGASLADLLRAPCAKQALVRRDVEVPEETWKAVRAIREDGRGAVFAMPHYGNREWANLSAPFSTLPRQTVVVRAPANPWLHRLVARLRTRTGQRIQPLEGAAERCVECVRDGEICAIPFDRVVPPDSGAAPVEFFGLPTFTTIAVGYAAAMTKAPVYLAYHLPIGGCRYRFVLKGPFDAPRSLSARDTAVETTRNVARALEQVIRDYPEAWAWWLERWRVRPKGAEGDYPSYAVDQEKIWPVDAAPGQGRIGPG